MICTANDEVVASSPYPGLVRVEDASDILSETSMIQYCRL